MTSEGGRVAFFLCVWPLIGCQCLDGWPQLMCTWAAIIWLSLLSYKPGSQVEDILGRGWKEWVETRYDQDTLYEKKIGLPSKHSHLMVCVRKEMGRGGGSIKEKREKEGAEREQKKGEREKALSFKKWTVFVCLFVFAIWNSSASGFSLGIRSKQISFGGNLQTSKELCYQGMKPCDWWKTTEQAADIWQAATNALKNCQVHTCLLGSRKQWGKTALQKDVSEARVALGILPQPYRNSPWGRHLWACNKDILIF